MQSRIAVTDQTPKNPDWNYHPDLPLENPSVFRWPPEPGFLFRWFGRNWLMLSERVLLLVLAVILWLVAYPSLADCREFAVGWVAQVWAVNMVVMIATAGGLHWFFYVGKRQESRLKFDHRDLMRSNRTFNFSDQVRDNMFWTLGSGVAFWTLFQVVTMWMMANGIAPVSEFSAHPVWFVLALILLPIWSAFHFYWVHRLLHVPALYRRFHALHHRNVNIGPWSGLSMHPVEHALYLTTICIHWVVVSHPIHLIFHLLYQTVGAAMTHTGYEDLLIRDKRRLALGTFYHTLHHRYYECNYGNQEMPWDRWFGTFHDGTEAGTKATRDRKREMYAGQSR